MSVHIIIQARWSSTRFPGKVGRKIAGMTVLEHVYRRARLVSDFVTVAVPEDDERRAEAALPLGKDVLGVGGDETDLIRRFVIAARRYPNVPLLIRLTSDCPWVPVSGIRAVAKVLEEDIVEYVETRHDPSTRPNGIDVQGFTIGLLAAAACEAKKRDREHVTGGLLSVVKAIRRIDVLEDIALDSLPPWRMTLDTHEDLDWFRAIAKVLPFNDPPYPRLQDLLALYHKQPELFRMDI